MLQARERVIGRFRPLLNAHGLTEQQWRIVRVLFDMGRSSRGDRRAVPASSPASRACWRAWRRSIWSTGERLEHDQRRVRVSLTPRSRALAARMAPQIEAIYAAIEAELGAKAIQQLYAALDTLIATLAAEDTPADGS